MNHPPLAMVLGVDSPIGLAVIRELGRHGVPVHGIGHAASIGRASRYCTYFSVRPAGPLAEWLPALIEASGAAATFAISENDLVALAALPARIGDCQILTPRADRLEVVLDKGRTLRLATALKMDVPKSWQPVAGEDFSTLARAITYPAVAKWADPTRVSPGLAAHGLGLIKAEFVFDADGLLALLERYAPTGCWPLVQSYCPGHGLGQMVHMEKGVATMAFQHRRLHEWPPEGGISTYCTAEPLWRHRAQMKRSVALLRAIGWQGAAMVEYRLDPSTGRYQLMEINGRLWGSLPLASKCGAHFAWEAYRRAVLGDESPAPVPHPDLRARYMIPETRRLIRLFFARAAIADPMFRARPWHDLARYLLAFVDPRTRYYVLDWRDPGPFARDCRNVLNKTWQLSTALLLGKSRALSKSGHKGFLQQ
ncbi:MAG: carboxylate--amine ligase [Sphingomonas sp.]